VFLETREGEGELQVRAMWELENSLVEYILHTLDFDTCKRRARFDLVTAYRRYAHTINGDRTTTDKHHDNVSVRALCYRKRRRRRMMMFFFYYSSLSLSLYQ
jgi:hypothetical protein